MLIGWKDLDAGRTAATWTRSAQGRTNAEAATLAQDIAAKLSQATPDQIDALVKENWEDPGLAVPASATTSPRTRRSSPQFKKLALRLKEKEVGIVKTQFGYHVIERVPPPPPDPLESADILARPAEPGTVYVQHVLIGWKDAPAVAQGMGSPAAKARTKADADKLAKDMLTKAKGGADFKALMKEYSEDPGSKDNGEPYPIDAKAQMVPPFKKLSLRLKEGEVGMVKSTFGWHVIKRVPPPPPAADSLESTDILKREPRDAEGEGQAHPARLDRGPRRRPARQRSARARTSRSSSRTPSPSSRRATKIEPLMKELSEDPGSAKTGEGYDVTPDAGLVEPFKNLSLRLKVGEVGVVKTQFGIHIIQRVE